MRKWAADIHRVGRAAFLGRQVDREGGPADQAV